MADPAAVRPPDHGGLLVVDDEPFLRDAVAASLRFLGFEVTTAQTGAEALRLARDRPFDLVVLDVMLPDTDGFEVITRLRRDGCQVPVIFLTAKDTQEDKVTGLTLGGDDYLTKPFDPGELAARLEVMLRRRNWVREALPVLKVGDLELDLVRHSARRGPREIELLPMEFKLLEFMMRNAGQTLSRRMIFETVWEYYFDPGTNLIEVYVSRLRKAIDGPGERPLIRTVRGQGYKIDAG